MGGGERGPYNLENDEEKDESGTTTTTTTGTTEMTTRMRIFVGDLGLNVKAEDLQNTFSCLGKLESVEIIRNQGRSFAYFDFVPSSPKSLSKLFGTYNGCKWKGGRLRLEKAKEHYLLRLRKEWAEDAKFTNSEPSNTGTRKTGSPEEFNNILNPEKREFRLFFPKLKKVKELPFKGTGKHKYSFQRVEVPPLPVHFCDCEEHSHHSYTAEGKDFLDLEAQGGGLDKKELDMMKLVMNKLLEREYVPKTSSEGAGLVKEGDNTKPVEDLVSDGNETYDITDNVTGSVDYLVAGENEMDNMTDEDDLIINVVAGGKKGTQLSGKWAQEVNLSNEGKIVDELQASKHRPSEHVLKSQGRRIIASDKKRKSPPREEAHGNKFLSANQSGREGSTKKAHLHQTAQPIELESGSQTTNTNSGSKKFAWRDLAGGRGNNSFSISDIMQSTVPNREKFESDGFNVPDMKECQNENAVKNINLESQSNLIEKTEELAIAQPTKSYADVNKYARGASWLQKSSWTQLVSEKHGSFSISQLLPATSLEKQEQVEPKSAANSIGSTHSKLVKTGTCASVEDSSKASRVGNKDIVTALDSSNMIVLDTIALDPEPNLPKHLQTLGETDDKTAPKKNHAAAEQLSVRNFTTDGTCLFMRSAASMREWTKAKAALSGSLKKQSKKQLI
ncbi:protein REPRESSOR OF SILENCING 3 [Rhododendron vialii]|uniref:protein REPRESSOR OF SILENCING 3 n=1 Tax=Rhododendron vialii TaxID=182163 RepID=UPI00265EE395|nr:protein REPRESSOR OF SILENCING 3 [Rhododendron vialii]